MKKRGQDGQTQEKGKNQRLMKMGQAWVWYLLQIHGGELIYLQLHKKRPYRAFFYFPGLGGCFGLPLLSLRGDLFPILVLLLVMLYLHVVQSGVFFD